MGRREIFVGSPAARYVIPATRDIYLDTGFIRASGRRLCKCDYLSRAYTGSVTFIELLSDITTSDREFAIRRATIENLLNTDVAIDWQTPNRKIPAAFDLLRNAYDIFDDTNAYLQKLAELAVRCRSRAEFADRLGDSPLRDAHHHFVQLDKQIDGVYKGAMSAWLTKSRATFAHPSSNMLLETLGLSADAPHDELCEAMAKSVVGRQIVVYAYTEFYAAEAGRSDVEFQEALYHSYDHSIDAFLDATSAKMWRNAAEHRQPARNDGTDEHHLLHLFPGATLVTTDRKFAAWVAAVGVPVRYESGGG
jgi:hypothetical protein